MPNYLYNIRKIVSLIFIRKIKRSGTFKGYHPNGFPRECIQYKDGILNGVYSIWYTNGKLETKAEFVNGKFDGSYRKWSENGDLQIENRFSNGILLEKIYEKSNNAIDRKPSIDESSLIQKTALRIATMLLIVSEVPDEMESSLFLHVRTVLKRYAFLELSNQDLHREIETMNGILKEENGKDWISTFRIKVSEFSKKILQPHERQNLLRIALAIAFFDGIEKGTQSIMGFIGETLGYSITEFKIESEIVMKEFGIEI